MDVATGLQAVRFTVRISLGAGDFPLLQSVQTGPGATSVRIQWVLVSFSVGQNGWRCDVDHSPPFKAEVKNEWSCTSAPLICLHGVDRDVLLPRILTRVVQGDSLPYTCLT